MPSIHFFVYTDGGVRPTNPGFAGSGVHGYYAIKDGKEFQAPKKPIQIQNPFMLEFIDSKDKSIPRVTTTTKGYQDLENLSSPLVKPEGYFNIVVSFENQLTNNQAELAAIATAFQGCKDIFEDLKTKDPTLESWDVTFFSDSEYVINALSVKQLPNSDIKNYDIIKDILLSFFELGQVKKEFIKVAAHTGEFGNSTSDYLATIGVQQSSDPQFEKGVKVNLFNAKFFEREIKVHPFLHGQRFIYNRRIENIQDQSSQIFMFHPSSKNSKLKDLLLGKQAPDGYAVVKLKEPCPSFKIVLEAQSRYNQHEDWPMNLNTERLYSRFVQNFLEFYGKHCLRPNKQGNGLYFLDDKIIAMEHNPPVLIYQAVDVISNLSEVLTEFENQDAHLKLLDITSHFYNEKGLKSEITVGYANHTVEIPASFNLGKHSKVTLHLGMDLPLRNSLKHLEKEIESIHLVVWDQGPNLYRYGTIVKAKTGIGIFACYHANMLVV